LTPGTRPTHCLVSPLNEDGERGKEKKIFKEKKKRKEKSRSGLSFNVRCLLHCLKTAAATLTISPIPLTEKCNDKKISTEIQPFFFFVFSPFSSLLRQLSTSQQPHPSPARSTRAHHARLTPAATQSSSRPVLSSQPCSTPTLID
jgi:hypothetical protein